MLETYVYFAVNGFPEHELITLALGIQPTKCWNKNDIYIRNGHEITRGESAWIFRINCDLHESEEFQMSLLIKELTPIRDKIANLNSQWSRFIVMVQYADVCNMDIVFSSDLVKFASSISASLRLDAYSLPKISDHSE